MDPKGESRGLENSRESANYRVAILRWHARCQTIFELYWRRKIYFSWCISVGSCSICQISVLVPARKNREWGSKSSEENLRWDCIYWAGTQLLEFESQADPLSYRSRFINILWPYSVTERLTKKLTIPSYISSGLGHSCAGHDWKAREILS